MKSLLKVLFFIILVCYVINVIRNNIILNSLKVKNRQINTLSEYSVEIIENDKKISKITKKDNNLKIENYITNIVDYYNSDTKKHISKNLKTQEITEDNVEIVANLIELEWNDIFKISLINFIIVENKKDTKIYKIQNYNNKSYMISSDGLILEIRDKNNVYKYEYNIGNINDSEFDF